MDHDQIQPAKPLSLPDDQARVLDALLDARTPANHTAASQLSPADFATAQRLSQLLLLIDQCPAGDVPADLVERTMARVRQAEASRGMTLATDPRQIGRGFPAREVMAVAAMLVVAVSMLFPVFSRVREQAGRVSDRSTLAAAGRTISLYAQDNADQLPRRLAQPGDTWWNVGKTAAMDEPVESNSAHLMLAAREGYIDLDALRSTAVDRTTQRLTADGMDWAAPQFVPYSYQNQFTKDGTRLNNLTRMPVMANKNPLFSAREDGKTGMRFNRELPLTSNSAAHHGQGQHVLYTDGGVEWRTSPILENGDNIYTAEGIDEYKGN
jgi:hypothetical protein